MDPVASFHVDELKKINYLEEINEYLIIRDDGSPILLQATCRHEGTRLPRLKEGETCITCPRHGWILDLEKGFYVNPIGMKHLCSNSHHAKRTGEKILIFPIDESRQKTGLKFIEDKQHLEKNEATFRFINHASFIFSTPNISLVTDPWIMGGAFVTGWFLSYQTSFAEVEKILNCTYCYISHSHPDHLNPLSLIYLKSLGWNPTFIIPDYLRKDSCKSALETIGFSRFIKLKNHEKVNLDPKGDTELLMIIDSSGRNDSGILIAYKGHTVLNLVDCPSPDIRNISDIDITLLPFANGASGYPVCWEDVLGIDKIREIKKIGNLDSINTFINRAISLKTKLAIPFAGYFSSLLEEDKTIDVLNIKNTPDDVRKRADRVGQKSQRNRIVVIDPTDQVSMQVDNGITICSSPKRASKTLVSNAETYRNLIFERYGDFNRTELVKFLSIQNFTDNLIVHFRAWDILFDQVSWSLTWDFSENIFLDSIEDIEIEADQRNRLLFIDVRNYALGYTVRNSLPWEEVSIGFQARFNRIPNVYNFSFWDYFQNSFNSINPIYGDLLDFWEMSDQLRISANTWFQ